MRVVTIRPLHGGYGTVPAGAVLDLPDKYASNLLKRGLVREAPQPVEEAEHPALVLRRSYVEQDEGEAGKQRKRRSGIAGKKVQIESS